MRRLTVPEMLSAKTIECAGSMSTPCRVWQGTIDKWGYGMMSCGGLRTGAHRFAWKQAFGAIPKGMLVCHKCDNPSCCNPDHLFLGTHADNMADMRAKGRVCKGEAWPRATRAGAGHYLRRNRA